MGDVIPVTAWTPECLAEYMQRPALFYSHRRHERIGSVIAVEPQYDDAARTSGGLWAEAKLFDAGSTQRSDEVWNMLNQTPSAHFGMSIGFRPLKSEPFENGGSEIGVLKLHEISIVSLPAAHLADVVEVRERAEEIEHVLMDDTGTWLRQLEDRGMDSRGAERALGCAIAACKTIAADADDYDERRATMLAESKRHPWERCAEATLHPAQVLAAAGWGSDQRLPDSA
ncbi:MAG: HK97 family phage prohead protease, partial [Armatimonadota bacterium]